jgi:hypothetical protein
MAGRSRSIIFSGRGSCSLRKATGGNEETSAHRMQTHADRGHLSVSCPTLVWSAQSFSLSTIVSQIEPENALQSPEKVKSPPTPKIGGPYHVITYVRDLFARYNFRISLQCGMAAWRASVHYRNSRNVLYYAGDLQPLSNMPPSGRHTSQIAAGP